MLFEHLIYSTAFAIIAGMIHFKLTGRDYSWIIITNSFAPDIDIFGGYIFKQFDVGVLINGIPLKHGDFHNIAVLFIYAVVVGLLLKTIGMRLKDSLIFAAIGFGAHIFEDVLVFNQGYAFLWPLSAHIFGIGIVEYKPDLYGIANSEVLIVGVIIMMLCGTFRIMYEGKGGLKRIGKAFAIAGVFLVMIPAIGFYNGNFKDEVRVGNIVDNWQFTQNAFWDSTVFHNGSHSAKIISLENKGKIFAEWRSDKIPVMPDTNYVFSSWGKTEGTGGNNSSAVGVIELDAKGRRIGQVNLVFGRGTNNWTQKRAIIKTLPNTKWVYVHGYIWKGFVTFWFDDVELYEDGTDKNILHNSGFEIGAKNIMNFKSSSNFQI